MTISVLLLIAGLVLLGFGGDWLVRGAVRLSLRMGMTEAVAGLTIVAMGTSAPELVVSLMAAIRGSDSIAVTNVVGSNIFNIAAVLGVCALIRPLRVTGNTVKMEWPFLFGTTVLFSLLVRDGELDFWEGAFFILAVVMFTAYLVRLAKKEVTLRESAELKELVAQRTAETKQLGIALGQVIIGSAFLVIGAKWMLDGAVDIARQFGLSERVIGLTIVAAGTGLPEFAASVMASFRKMDDVAIGNIIGSCIFNILWILGLSSIIHPLAIEESIIHFDNWWLIGITFILFPLMRKGFNLVRWEGAALTILYVTYTGLLLFRPQ